MDSDFARKQFPAFSEPSLQGKAFFENAGGSYCSQQVLDRLTGFYRKTKVQPYHSHPVAIEAGEAMDASYPALAAYLGVDADEIYLGPSTSQNTYVLANAFRSLLSKGDEIIVTNQDHEANSGVWRRLEHDGLVVREWQVDAETGSLNVDDLKSLLNDKTRLLAFTQCSNILGQINPVAEITALAKSHGVLTVVDGVSFAPHGLPNVSTLGADIYLFSLYKVFGPHQGLMVVRRDMAEQLGNQAHFFNEQFRDKRLTPAGPDHAQVAAAIGVAEYFDALYEFHRNDSVNLDKANTVRQLIADAERENLERLMGFLNSRTDLDIIGPKTTEGRAATVSIVPHNQIPIELVSKLAKHDVLAGSGHFYSYRLLKALGIDVEHGVTRFSFVHYTSADEVEQLIAALEASL